MQAYSWPNWRDDGAEFYFAYGGLGVVRQTLSGKAVVYDALHDSYYSLEGNGRTTTRAALTAGCGYALLLGGSLGFEAGAELDVVFAGSGDAGGMAYLGDIKFGLVYFVR
jgi:hypothetical protein